GVDAGLDVVVAAPTWDSSGASASLTVVEEDGRFLVEQRCYDELPDVPVFAVEGAPAFIARAGLRGAFGEPPDVVLSGINVRAHLSAAGVVQTTVTELGKGYVKLSHAEGDGDAEPGSDMAMLAAGYACVTPLLAPCEASDVDMAGLADAADRLTGRTR